MNKLLMGLVVSGVLMGGGVHQANAQPTPQQQLNNATIWRQGWDMQVADLKNSASIVGLAIGCGIVSPYGNARQLIFSAAQELWNQGVVHGAVRPKPGTNGTQLDLSLVSDIDQKMRDAEASVKVLNRCDFWKSQPSMAYKLQQLDGG